MEKLGEGTYGVVYMAREKQTGAVVALKRMNIAAEEEGVPATTIREICLLKELHHENIVRLYDVMFQAPKLTLVFEYCDFDLKKYMESKPGKRLDLYETKCILKQMLCGLQYMHARSVVHRDLKPQNVLLSLNRDVKLADFGLARVEGIPVKKYSHEAVTLWYRPPDVICGSTNYGFQVDMWSMGCIFAEMLTGAPLFNGHSDGEQLLKIFKLFGTPTKDEWPGLLTCPNVKVIMSDARYAAQFDQHYTSNFHEFIRNSELCNLGEDGIELLKGMLQFQPSRRISAADAYNHPFLHGVPDSQSRAVEVMAIQLQQVLDSIRNTAGTTQPAQGSARDSSRGESFDVTPPRAPQPPAQPRREGSMVQQGR
jgi:cyclin-dependent kinase